MPRGKRGPARNSSGVKRPTTLIIETEIRAERVGPVFRLGVLALVVKGIISPLKALALLLFLGQIREVLILTALQELDEYLQSPLNPILDKMREIDKDTGSLRDAALCRARVDGTVHIFYNIPHGKYAKTGIDKLNDPEFKRFASEHIREYIETELFKQVVDVGEKTGEIDDSSPDDGSGDSGDNP